jgi:hypothetical protein
VIAAVGRLRGLLAALAPEYVLVGADRRLSDNGQSVEKESTKLTVLVT